MWEVIEPSLRTLRAISDPLFDGDRRAMADEHGRLVALLRQREPGKAAQAFGDHAAGRGPVPDARETKQPRKKAAAAKRATSRKTAPKSN